MLSHSPLPQFEIRYSPCGCFGSVILWAGMKKKTILLLLLLLCIRLPGMYAENLEPANRYPIVLVGGFMTFGRDEALGFRYWGGTEDIQQYLEDRGYQVYTADIGPLASNHDRACELFADIAGGRVDYGKHHAEAFGHERFGGVRQGLYPQWGSVDPATGKVRKVHLVCHSMGGQTARVLARLLEEGDEAERKESGTGCSPLFNGGRAWIESITTLATPHNGSTLTRAAPYIEDFITLILAFLEASNSIVDGKVFDFGLDHWGISPGPEEGIVDIRKRLDESRLWEKTKDFSYHDLTPEGAKELNRRTPACGDIYYFSWAACHDGGAGEVFSGLHPGLLPSALFMENYAPAEGDPDWLRSHWHRNDGIVNTASMPGPAAGSADRIVSFDGLPRRGIWNYMGILSACDHLDIIGINLPVFSSVPDDYPSTEEWYLDLCRFLWSLD